MIDEDAIHDVERHWSARARLAITRLRFRTAHKKVALAISGGGSQGSFEAGALLFLYDHVGIEPFAICGNSVGAIIAAKLAEGNDAATGRRSIDETVRIWRGMTSNSDMWEMEPWFLRLQSSASWASDLREQLLETGASAAQGRLVLRLLSNVVRRAPETDGTLGALRQALRAQSLLSIEPVRRLIARELHPEFLASSGIMLRLGTVGLESGELRYVTETGSFVSRENQPLDLPTVPIAEAVIASSSIPLIFPPIVIGDEHYVDGGVREILPLHHPFTYLGAEQIFAIAAGAIGVQPAPSFEGRGMLDIARRVMTDIGPDETIRGELDPPRGWGRRVAIVVPEFDVHDALTVDSALIAISIDYGWMRAADVLLNLPRPVAQLSRDIAEARVRLRELNGPIESILAPSLPPADSDEAAAEREAVRDRLEASIAARRAAGGPLPPGHPRWERDTVFTD